MERDQVRDIALANGFELKEQKDGTRDLHPNVYAFARSLLRFSNPEDAYVGMLEESNAAPKAENQRLREAIKENAK